MTCAISIFRYDTRSKYIENSVCTRVTNCFSAHERVILVFINKYKNKTRVNAETVRYESTYIILFLTRHNVSINDDKNDNFTHHPCVSLARFSFCWWRHYLLPMTSQSADNCDAITWTAISNSLDIDFIHGNIHPCHVRNFYTFSAKFNTTMINIINLISSRISASPCQQIPILYLKPFLQHD